MRHEAVSVTILIDPVGDKREWKHHESKNVHGRGVNHQFSEPVFKESNHVPLAVIVESAFVKERSTLEHVSVSGGENSDHEVEHEDVDDENMEDDHEGVNPLVLFHPGIRVTPHHSIKSGHQRLEDVPILILVDKAI